ncbi:hypothetical protein PR048_015911 [Dryococelus australis]|uniref:Uncharacterized protein n=1 Tax=Dryococelus australis TaxID=614101 RepID=A0ABQ9HI87_9NEOP|nr:hypothetical protein PR048_015911 [Dryococelus australis]
MHSRWQGNLFSPSLSDDSNHPSYLSPGHVVIGGLIKSFPEPDLSDVSMKQLSRWQQVQQAVQQFWTL